MLLGLLMLFVAVPAALAASSTLSYDPVYDNAKLSTDQVACSTGSHGLASKYKTIGKFPTYPNVGGVPAIAGYNSPNCGTCWTVTYKGKNITITGIDHSKSFNVAEASMNKLTKGKAEELGRVDVTYTQVPKKLCGL